MPAIEFTIDIPVSNNDLYRVVKGRSILSSDGRQWYEYAVPHIQRHTPAGMIEGPVTVIYTFHFHDNRRRDIFNYEKALSDAITKAGVWGDDSQIVHGSVAKRVSPGNPHVAVSIVWG